MTTTGGSAGRPNGAGAEVADERVRLACARGLFARAAEALDRQLRALSAEADAGAERERIKTIETLIREAQRALLVVLEFEAKLDRREPEEAEGGLDLEAARAEIARRLARLAERG